MALAFVPTSEQRGAIEHPLADACTVAGAGSGKTAVLTARFVHLVDAHGLPVRRVAALTFTEKAAAQMRERIAAALESRGRLADLEEVEFAPISTIHSFCARLLRLHAVDAGLDPAFQVLDANESLLLREDAWDEALRRLVREGAPAVAALSRIALTDARGELLALLEKVRGSGVPADAVHWCSGAIDAASAVATVEECLVDLGQEAALDPVADARLRALVVPLREALAAGPGSGWRLRELIADVKAVKPERGNGKRPLQTARKALGVAVEKAAAVALDEVGRTEVAPALGTVLGAVDEVYEGAKRERGALDFTDLEVLTLRLLESLAAGGRRLAQAPAALLVDEYQDTNPLQARLLEALRTLGSPQFSVGDPKQSIYRFRRADVRVIGAEAERVGTAGRHLLQATFRARPELVDCLNALHEPLFAGGKAGAEHVPLRAEGLFEEVEGPDVELVVLDGGADASAEQRRMREAHWIATWIRDLVSRGVERAKGGEAPSTLGYGDVAILLRARTNLTIYEDALAALDIPFHTHKGRGFFQTEEIADLIHVLRVIHDPADDHAFACFVTGPAVGGGDEDLLRLFPDRADGAAAPGEAWSRFAASERWSEVAATVGRLRREALAGRLGHVVEAVLRELGLLAVALLQPDGARRGANLRKAVAVAREMERGGRHGLDDLLRQLESQRDREVAESEAAVGRDGEDVVRINSVHGAKGLEYPVVILADVGRRAMVGHDAIRFDGEGGVATKLRHPLEGSSTNPAGLERLADEERKREEEESRRLLYVATTRAEERLLLVGTNAGTKRDGALKQFDGWGPWLLDALKVQPGPDPVERTYGRGQAVVRFDEAPTVPARASPPVRTHAPSAAACAAADALCAEACEPVAPLGETPYAVTVSELMDFAASPARHHERRLEPRSLPERRATLEPEDPASGGDDEDERGARQAERARLWDEEAVSDPKVDRAALGRILHALLESLEAGADAADQPLLERAVAAELSGPAPAAVVDLLQTMVARYAASPTGSLATQALRSDAQIRREVAFHARIRFPAGATVGGFDSLLVRGSIDLWLADADGLVHVVDHKTNPPSTWLPTPEAVAAHYAWQLRLYALAAERLRGEDVAGARLLLLDPGWGPEAVEVEVDVSGAALEEARRLCQAYAVASLEDRWPASWADLLSEALRTA